MCAHSRVTDMNNSKMMQFFVRIIHISHPSMSIRATLLVKGWLTDRNVGQGYYKEQFGLVTAITIDYNRPFSQQGCRVASLQTRSYGQKLLYILLKTWVLFFLGKTTGILKKLRLEHTWTHFAILYHHPRIQKNAAETLQVPLTNWWQSALFFDIVSRNAHIICATHAYRFNLHPVRHHHNWKSWL